MAAKLFTFAAIFVVALQTLDGVTAFSFGSNPHQTSTSLDAVSRREAFVASASAAMLVGVPMDALAGQGVAPSAKPDKATAAKFYFNGVFRDQKHPEGYRIVAGAVNKQGILTMRDNPEGKISEVPFMAKKSEETGEITVDMDLSVYQKGFPKSVVATVTKDGCMKFPDGNIWIKQKGVAGLYIDGFAPYPKYRRIVVPGDDKNVAVTMVSGSKVFDVAGIDLGKKGIQVEFPGNKQCTGKFNQAQGTITWRDGNVWTKV